MTSDNEEILAQRVEYLEKLIKSTKPICPICLTELKPFNYVGYYDAFSGYECNCNHFEDGENQHGQYA
jgi:hypothetical protein